MEGKWWWSVAATHKLAQLLRMDRAVVEGSSVRARHERVKVRRKRQDGTSLRAYVETMRGI